jgi:cytochrome P450
MFPPLFGHKAKLAPPGGDTIKGIFFPEGTEVAICDDAMMRRQDVFGPDSHLFRPDRWIEADAEKKVKYRQTVDSVFGTGRFQCLGRHIAMMELHKALAEVPSSRVLSFY